MNSGLLIKSTGSWFTVEQEDGKIISCRLRGQFKIKGIESTNPLAVGDRVNFNFEADGTGVIYEIEQRKNYIIRKATKLSKQVHILASNLDRAWMIASLISPKTSMGFIDRFLITATAYGIPATVVFNKSDLYTEEVMEFCDELISIYEPLGYKCIKASSTSGEGIDIVREDLSSGIHLFSGLSGAGKSSLINQVDANLNLKTGTISKYHQKGMHTTTFAEMFKLNTGAYIIDTPGIRDFGTIEMVGAEITSYFPEMLAIKDQCQFNNCLHDNEPGCAIKGAVEEGTIHPWRYYNYISILHNEDRYK